MAVQLPPVTVPERVLYPEERSAELHIYSPVVGIPQIRIINQHVDRLMPDGEPVNVGPVETNDPYALTMLEFLIMCPELSDVPQRVSDAMDMMKTRMPTRRFVPQQPTLTSLSAITGPAAGNNVIVLTGTNFGYSMAVIFGDAAPVMAMVPNRTTAYVHVPAGVADAVVDVTVVLVGLAATLPAAYTYTE